MGQKCRPWHGCCYDVDPEQIMKNLIAIVFALSLALPNPGMAQQRGGSSGTRATAPAAALARRVTLMAAHRVRLESRLGDQTSRIRRLKAQPAGVRRDFQLKSALRSNRELSSRLSRLQSKINGMSRELIRVYSGAISRTTDPSRRAQLVSRRAALVRQLRGKGRSKIVTDEKAAPLDSAEDLEEKADLLEDSHEKIRRQLVRIARQLAQLKRRARLRRHARAADHNPFDESSAGRTARAKKALKSAATSGTERAKAPQSSDDANSVGAAGKQPSGGGSTYNGTKKNDTTPAPPHNLGGAPGQSGTSGGGNEGTKNPPSVPSRGLSSDRGSAASAAGGAQPFVALKDVIDPSVLRELRRSAHSGKNIKARIAALERARLRLDSMSRSMKSKASTLRNKARTLRRSK